MHIQPGDYMILFDFKAGQGEKATVGFARQSSSGLTLEPIKLLNGEDRQCADFLSDDHSAGHQFWRIAMIIAETHDMIANVAGPYRQADYAVLRNHPAVQFIARST